MARPRKADPQKTIIGFIIIVISIVVGIMVLKNPVITNSQENNIPLTNNY